MRCSFFIFLLFAFGGIFAQDDEKLKEQLIEQFNALDALERKVNELKQVVSSLPNGSDLTYEKIQNVQKAFFQLQDLLPQIPATVQGLPSTYPQLAKTLEKFLSKGDAYRKEEEVKNSLMEIKNAPDWFAGRLNSKARGYWENMQQVMTNSVSTEKFLKDYGKDKGTASVYANQLLGNASEIEAMALGIFTLYPNSEAHKSAFSEEQTKWVQDATLALQRVKALRALAANTIKEAAEIEQKRLENARFPAPKMSGGEWDTLTQEVEKILTKEWGTAEKKVVRVGIDSDWEIRQEWKFNQDKWVWEHFKFFWAKVALELPEGTARVYSVTFRCMKIPGGWGPLSFWGTAESYSILPQNIHAK